MRTKYGGGKELKRWSLWVDVSSKLDVIEVMLRY